MNSSLGALKVGQATLAGDITVCLGACSSDMVLSNTAHVGITCPLQGSSDLTLSVLAALRKTVPLSGFSDIVSLLSGPQLDVEMFILFSDEPVYPSIDFLAEPTYPMIVVTEAVEPVPTNTISVQAF